MKLSFKSFWVCYYRFFYGVQYESKMPKNMCPFFWQLVFGLIVGIPFTIFVTPSILLNKTHDDSLYDTKPWERIFQSFFLWCVLWILGCMIIGLSCPFVYKTMDGSRGIGFCIGFGFLIDCLALLVGLIIFMRDLRDDGFFDIFKKTEKVKKEKKPNWFIEGIKAWYEKRCPIIEYTDVNGKEPDKAFSHYADND